MKPKLYQYAACPFCNKVRSMLEYKGVEFDTIEVHPLNKKEIAFSAGYRAVPIYIDSTGAQVNDSTPIMRRIDAEFPEPKVFREDADGRETEDKWLVWSERFVKGLPTAIYNSLPKALQSFDYITKTGKFKWHEQQTIKWMGAFVMTMVSKKIAKREGITNPDEFLRERAREWAEGLNGRHFMGGTTPNGADLAVFGIVRAVASLPAGKALAENRAFEDWRLRVQKLLSISAHFPAQAGIH